MSNYYLLRVSTEHNTNPSPFLSFWEILISFYFFLLGVSASGPVRHCGMYGKVRYGVFKYGKHLGAN